MMRKLLTAAAASAVACAAAPLGATAYVVDGGEVTAPGAYQLIPTGVQTLGVGSYSDSYLFRLISPQALTASNFGTQANGANSSNLNFGTISLRRFNDTLTGPQLAALAAANSGSSQTGVSNANSFFVSNYTNTGNVNGDEGAFLQGQLLQAGSYAIVVNFSVVAPPTTYNGNLNFSNVTNVPEPASWAMMILGLGMIGAAARRRRQQVQTTFA